MSTCACCGQSVPTSVSAEASRLRLLVDETVIWLCNRAHDLAVNDDAVAVEIVHWVLSLEQVSSVSAPLAMPEAWVTALIDAARVNHQHIRGADVHAFASVEHLGADHPVHQSKPTSDDLKQLLTRAADRARRDRREVTTADDVILALLEDCQDLPAAQFIGGLAGDAHGPAASRQASVRFVAVNVESDDADHSHRLRDDRAAAERSRLDQILADVAAARLRGTNRSSFRDQTSAVGSQRRDHEFGFGWRETAAGHHGDAATDVNTGSSSTAPDLRTAQQVHEMSQRLLSLEHALHDMHGLLKTLQSEFSWSRSAPHAGETKPTAAFNTMWRPTTDPSSLSDARDRGAASASVGSRLQENASGLMRVTRATASAPRRKRSRFARRLRAKHRNRQRFGSRRIAIWSRRWSNAPNRGAAGRDASQSMSRQHSAHHSAAAGAHRAGSAGRSNARGASDRSPWPSRNVSRSDRSRSSRHRSDRDDDDNASAEDSDEKRFYLSVDDDVVDAPAIGARTAERLYKVNIRTVRDLLDCDVDAVAGRAEGRAITAERLAQWQAQARMVCTVPWLRGTHAQLLVGAGYDSVTELRGAEATAVCRDVLRYCATRDGQRILRAGPPPDISRIIKWIEHVALAEPARAA